MHAANVPVPSSLLPLADPFRLLVESVQDYAIYLLDPAGLVASWNIGAERMFGYRAEEIIGQTCSCLYPLPSAASLQAALDIARTTGRHETEEQRRRQDGALFWAVVTTTALRGPAGEHVGFARVIRDVTERKQTAEALRRSNRSLRMFKECNQQLIHATDETTLLQAVCRILVESGGYRMAWVGFATADEARSVRPAAWAGFEDGYLDAAGISWSSGERGRGPTGIALRTGAPAVVPDVATQPDFAPWRESATRRGYASLLALPLHRDGRPFAALTVYAAEPDAFDADEIALLTELANDLAFGLLALRTQQAHREIEESLRRSEDRYRHLFEANPHPMWVYDRGTLRFLAVNDAAIALYGYARDEFQRMTIADIRPPEDVPRLRDRVAAVPSGGIEQAGTWRHRKRDGSLVEAEVSWHGFDLDGRPAVVAAAYDVTVRRQVEAEFRKLLTAVTASADGIVITDPRGRIEWVNPAFTRITGYAPEEVSGLNPRVLKSGEQDERYYTELWQTITAGRVWRGKLRNRRKDGTVYTEEMTITPVREGDGGIAHFIAIKRDVTDQEKLEHQLLQAQKMEAIGRLAGGIAHDFNNLLTIINGYSEIVLSGLSYDSPHHEPVRLIREAGERAAALTRQLLTFSRKAVLAPQVLDPNAVIRDTEKLLRPLIGEDILLTTVLDPTVNRIRIDPVLMGQVLTNLAVNARDAMPTGGRLTIETRRIDLDEQAASAFPGLRPGRYVLLAVSDTGCGMAAEVKAHLFEPFFTTKRAGKGTGLGLATVYGIVQQSGGVVRVYSEPGRGAVFKLYFPTVEDAPLPTSRPASRVQVRGTETVLLVEDEKSLLQMAQICLQGQGYTVLTATGGMEALDVLSRQGNEVHLLVTDVVMPGMDGRQLAETLMARFPRLKVLFASGYTDDAIVRHGILQAEVAFLEKPYTPLGLLRKVRQVLDGTP